jgi:hypothetical protein
MARLLKDPQVEHYLLAIALWETRFKPEEIDGADFDSQFRLATEGMLQELNGYLVADVRDVLYAAMRRARLGKLKFGALLLVLALELAENRVERLLGSVPQRPMAEVLLSELKDAGLNLKPWLRPRHQLEVKRARDRFQLTIERVLLNRAAVAPLTREEIVFDILSAYDASAAVLEKQDDSDTRRPKRRSKKLQRGFPSEHLSSQERPLRRSRRP